MGKADRRAAKKQRSAEAKAARARAEIWPEPLEEPVMVTCDGCQWEQVNAHVRPGDSRFVFPCICGCGAAAYA